MANWRVFPDLTSTSVAMEAAVPEAHPAPPAVRQSLQSASFRRGPNLDLAPIPTQPSAMEAPYREALPRAAGYGGNLSCLELAPVLAGHGGNLSCSVFQET
jgi:hypothetical protein